jgi:hypothetical protein
MCQTHHAPFHGVRKVGLLLKSFKIRASQSYLQFFILLNKTFLKVKPYKVSPIFYKENMNIQNVKLIVSLHKPYSLFIGMEGGGVFTTKPFEHLQFDLQEYFMIRLASSQLSTNLE